jgi:hypothetical protein
MMLGQQYIKNGRACAYKHGRSHGDNCHFACTSLLPHSWYINELANILRPFSLNLHVHHFITGSDGSVYPVLLLHTSLSAPSFSRWGSFLSQFIEWDSPSIILCLQKIFILYWNKLLCFLRLFHILVLLFCKVFEPNRCFILQMNFDIFEGFIGPNYSWTLRCNCQHLFNKLQSDTMHKKHCSYMGCSLPPTAFTFHRECNKRRLRNTVLINPYIYYPTISVQWWSQHKILLS